MAGFQRIFVIIFISCVVIQVINAISLDNVSLKILAKERKEMLKRLHYNNQIWRRFKVPRSEEIDPNDVIVTFDLPMDRLRRALN
ncbi:unnamed protein product [Bursaphelenchus xylophilus]|uniref:(pine wood nematode) hypothetical protein n=1 Tax=Bursaphelenchus xylophilus TaxID=6326 RepID=A0A1I7SUJ3_BURXY|nr:unnamed protein product [Bursaphelenchus xylophilus]CAG9107064.1 unnamed protein product [Bursaphelenchus xylophilus]